MKSEKIQVLTTVFLGISCISVSGTHSTSTTTAAITTISTSAATNTTAQPTITCNPKTISSYEGSQVSFTCMIDGELLPRPNQVFWAVKGEGIFLTGTGSFAEGAVTSVATNTNDGRLQVVLTVTVSASMQQTIVFIISAVNHKGLSFKGVSVTLHILNSTTTRSTSSTTATINTTTSTAANITDGELEVNEGNGGSVITISSKLSLVLFAVLYPVFLW